MSRRTRNFLIGSSLVLSVGLCTGLVAYYSGGLPLGAAAAPDDFAYMPSDTSAVAYADVRAIMNSEFRKRLKAALPTGEEQEKLKAETGIDVEHDLDTVIAGFTGDEADAGGAVVLVRGRFNDSDIEFRARQHGATVEEYQGKRLLLMTHGEHGTTATPERDATVAGDRSTGGLAFLEPGLIALGEARAIKRAIDARATKTNITANTEMMAFVEQVQGGSNAWVVGKFDALSKTADLPSEIQSKIPPVQWFAVSANVNGGLSGTVRAEARDETSAEELRAVVGGALAAGRLMSGQDERATAVLNSLQLTGTGKSVAIAFNLPADVLDVLGGIAAAKGAKGGR
jgi:hypothetical protein